MMVDREGTYQDNNGEINVNTEMNDSDSDDSKDNESVFKKAMRIAQNAPVDVANHFPDKMQ